MHRGLLLPLAALVVLATLAGCSFVRPTAKAVGVRVVEMGPSTARLAIEVELRNESSNEVELVSYDYLVRLEDGASYDGRWAALRALPPGQSVTASVPAIVPVQSARAGARWSVTGTLAYRDPQSLARILYEAGILKTESMFEGQGSVAIAEK